MDAGHGGLLYLMYLMIMVRKTPYLIKRGRAHDNHRRIVRARDRHDHVLRIGAPVAVSRDDGVGQGQRFDVGQVIKELGVGVEAPGEIAHSARVRGQSRNRVEGEHRQQRRIVRSKTRGVIRRHHRDGRRNRVAEVNITRQLVGRYGQSSLPKQSRGPHLVSGEIG